MRAYVWGGLLVIVVGTILSQQLIGGKLPIKQGSELPLPTNLPRPPSMSPTRMVLPSPTARASIIQITPKLEPTKLSEIAIWLDPDCAVLTQSESKSTLECGQAAEMITQWYQDRLQHYRFSARTSITTTTNGVVLNKLTGKNNQEQISIDIAQSLPKSNKVLVTVQIR
jgi:hypothetical protein